MTEKAASKSSFDNVSTKEPINDEATFGEDDDAGDFFELDGDED
jgi:hypothetical protein